MHRCAIAALVLAACHRPPADSTPATPRLRFDDAGLPGTADEAARVRVSPRFRFGSTTGPVVRQVVAANGQDLGGTTFGALVDLAGTPLDAPDGTRPWLTYGLDFNGLHQVGDQVWMTTHVESIPGAIYQTALDVEDGLFTATTTAPVDVAAVQGIKDPCAGTYTPWGTHLGGEEYEPDARRIGADGRFTEPLDRYDRAWNDLARVRPDGTPPWPYDAGWIFELGIDDAGTATVTKHRAPGRFSHELGTVLPDGRTMYLSDDQSARGGLFLFVAAEAEDLSHGTLYALSWSRLDEAGVVGTARWVPLGYFADPDADIGAVFADRSLRFSDLFDAADPVDGTCPEGLNFVQHALGDECLAVREGQHELASRLETRRVAALEGATVEWSKTEGVAWDPDDRAVWVAISNHGAAMTDGEGDIALDDNGCGAIWRYEGLGGGQRDTTGELIDSAFVATRFRQVLAGRPDGSDRGCHVDGIANPDNIAYLRGSELLVIAEDTLKHRIPTLWAYETDTSALVRLATGPECAEWTGLSWAEDLAGHGYLTVSLQHAYAYKTCEAPTWPEGEPATWSGVLGPFPALAPPPIGGPR